MSERIAFAKMNGLGNEIIVADMRARNDRVTPQAAIALAGNADTHFDQLMAIHSPSANGKIGRDARIEILNSDGSMAEACGNGTRCVVDWLIADNVVGALLDSGENMFSFEVEGQPLKALKRKDGLVSVNMGVPRFDWEQIPLSEEFADTRRIELQIGPIDTPILHTPSVANIGNPHVIFWAPDQLDSYALEKFGPMIEHHPLFPDRVNVSIARVEESNVIALRTWERGAGLTQACGSAACAAAVCAARLGLTGRHVFVDPPGGRLEIEWRDDNHIIMTGPTEHEFSGTLDPLTGDWSRAS